MKKIILVFSLLVFFSDVYSQVTTNGVTLPAKLGKESKLMVLNGGGVRNRYMMNVYVAGLYLRKKNSNAPAILDTDEPMAVRLTMISALITQDRMAEAIREGFEKSTGGNTKPIQKEIDLIVKIFYEAPIKVGDTFDIWYMPGKGVTASKNSKQYDFLIPGLKFKKYLFGIWLGQDPVDEPLKDKMLGL